MARPRNSKNMTLEEKLELVIKNIEESETKLKNFKAEKKQIESEIKQKKMDELLSIVEESGKSIDEVVEMLKNN